jgi:hypothetical protein
MSTPEVISEDVEAAGKGEQLMSPFRGGCKDGHLRKTHLKIFKFVCLNLKDIRSISKINM